MDLLGWRGRENLFWIMIAIFLDNFRIINYLLIKTEYIKYPIGHAALPLDNKLFNDDTLILPPDSKRCRLCTCVYF